MTGINSINHANPLTQTKVNYFIDYFNFVLHFCGLLPEFELDNLHSILDKMSEQVEKNNSKSIAYLDNYLSKKHILYNPYLNLFAKYKKFKKEVSKYKSSTTLNKKKSYIKSNPSFTYHLNELKNEVGATMFSKSLDAIISCLLCEHKLEKHKGLIQFHTKILVTEFIFNRRSKQDVDVFKKIFTKECSEFPYPNHFKTTEEKENYFKSRDLLKSFKAIEDLLNQEQDVGWIIFRIEKLLLPKNYKFSYDNIELCSPYNKKYESFKSIVNNNKHFKEVFGKYNYSLAAIPSKYHNIKLAHQDGVRKLDNLILYLNSVLQIDLKPDRINFAHTNNFNTYGYSLRLLNQTKIIGKYEKQEIEDNPFSLLAEINPVSKEFFLSHEVEFLKAMTSRSISDYWRYLEVLLFNEESDKQVKEIVAGAMLLNEKYFKISRIETYLRSAIGVLLTSNIALGISIEEQLKFMNSKSNLKDLSKIINSQFFNDAIHIGYKRQTKIANVKTFEFYKSVITELYEQRNMHEHVGIIHERAALKIDYTIPKMITRFRWVIFDTMRKYPNYYFNEIIAQIKVDYNKLL
jgi:hypothetical protein